MMPGPAKKYEYFIVALTKQGKLVSDYIRANSIADAMDIFLERNDLEQSIEDYKFCLRKELMYDGN